MVIQKRRKAKTGFQGTQILVAHAQRGVQQTQQQMIVNQTLGIDATLFKQITRHIKPLGPGATPQQKEQALGKLYNLLRIGGTLGIKYQSPGKAGPRSPNEVLRNKSADCDELSRLFVAAARKLNIGISSISMGAMEFNTTKPGSPPPEKHAALFITLGKKNFIIDPVMRKVGMRAVADFKDATVGGVYRGYRIARGPGWASHPITALVKMQKFGNVADITAAYLLERANHYHGLATKGKTTDAVMLNHARVEWERAVKLGSGDRYITKNLGTMGGNLFSEYQALGNRASRTKHFRTATTYYKSALGIYSTLPKLKNAKNEYLVRESLGYAYQRRKQYKLAFNEFSAMIKLRPTDGRGYRRKMHLAIVLGKAARRNRAQVRSYYTLAFTTGRNALSRISSGSSHRGVIQRNVTALRRIMQKRGWTIPS